MTMKNLTPGSKEYIDAVNNWYMRMIDAYKAMPIDEKRQLESWRKQYRTFTSLCSIADWPGWEKYIGRKPRGYFSI